MRAALTSATLLGKRVRTQGKKGKAAWSKLEEVLADRKLKKDLTDFDDIET